MNRSLIKSFLYYTSFPLLLLLGARLISIIALPLSGLIGYGDFPNFFQLAKLPGWPFINYWVEFPPIFPFLNTVIYRFSGGQEATYDYILALFLLGIDIINLLLFVKLNSKINNLVEGRWRILTYLVTLISFSYTWWYFDSLAVLGMLLAFLWLFDGRDFLAGTAIAFGTLVKLFPIIIIIIVWRYYSKIRALKITLICLTIVFIIFGSLYLISPVFTKASISSQLNKGSWETIWALIDGNLSTGNFGPYSERIQPEMATLRTRNPSVINPLITICLFGLLGLFTFFRSKVSGPTQIIAFTGFTLCLLFLWSPGWSPQWVLFLLPLVLLSFPQSESLLLTITLIFVNLLEWPLLLSRGLFNDLWITVSLRSLVLILSGYAWSRLITQKSPTKVDYKVP